MDDLGLGDHAWSGTEMWPRRAMNEEWVANIHVTGATNCTRTGALERRSRQVSNHVAEEHTPLAKRREHARYIEVRSYKELRRCIHIADIREQEQRQEPAAATVHIYPPLPVHVIAPVDVPAGVSGIPHAGEAHWKGSANSFTLHPTARPEERIVCFPERWCRAGGRERRTLGAREADNGLGPGRGIVWIDRSRAQSILDDVHASAHNVWRYRTPNHEKSICTEVVDECRHLAHQRGPPNAGAQRPDGVTLPGRSVMLLARIARQWAGTTHPQACSTSGTRH